jgi:hypothetical protein
MRAQTGVAWLSYRGKSPVLPIGFSGTLGALENGLKLRRPTLSMRIGKIIPPIEMLPTVPRKTSLENYSESVMNKVRDLILVNDPSTRVLIENERFNLSITVQDNNNFDKNIPPELAINHDAALAKLLHRPAILKLFQANLQLPIEVLRNLDQANDPQTMADALKAILNYLDNENAYLLMYRFGPKAGSAMKKGLEEFFRLTTWAAGKGYKLQVIPIRKYYSIEDKREVVQIKQNKFENWM